MSALLPPPPVVRDQLLQRDGHVAVDLDARVERVLVRPQNGPEGFGLAAVDVPVDVVRAPVPRAGPREARVVAHPNAPVILVDVVQGVADLDEVVLDGEGLHPPRVVVPDDEVLPAEWNDPEDEGLYDDLA